MSFSSLALKTPIQYGKGSHCDTPLAYDACLPFLFQFTIFLSPPFVHSKILLKCNLRQVTANPIPSPSRERTSPAI